MKQASSIRFKFKKGANFFKFTIYNRFLMEQLSFVPKFGKIFLTSLILVAIGASGLFFVFLFLEPTVWPRWLFFLFLTLAGAGLGIPAAYLLQRRVAKQIVPASVIIREGLLLGIFLDLIAWLQIARIASNLAIFLIAGGLCLLEFFLRMAEKATFQPGR